MKIKNFQGQKTLHGHGPIFWQDMSGVKVIMKSFSKLVVRIRNLGLTGSSFFEKVQFLSGNFHTQ